MKFDEYLDLSNYTTSGSLSTIPSLPISSPTPSVTSSRSSTPTPSLYSRQQTIYRLSAIVCHYGQHSFGHYVAYRRKPRPESAGAGRWTPPRLSCPFGCQCEKCALFGSARDDPPSSSSRRGGGWLRISDASVEEVGIETVLAEQSGTFMLYYERVLPPLPPPSVPYAESGMTRSSEETVVATPIPPSTTHTTATPTHAQERRMRIHSVANNENEEDKKEVRVEAERRVSISPWPDLHLPLVKMGVAARIIRSTSVRVRSNSSQGSRSQSSSVAPPPPPVANYGNGHAAPTVQGPPHTLKVNGIQAHGSPIKQVRSPTKKKKKKKNPSSVSTGDINTNGAPPWTSVGSGYIDRSGLQL